MPTRPPSHRPNGPRRPADNRPSAAARGYDRAWQLLREAVLNDVRRERFPEGGPVCRECEARGVQVSAVDVDHIVPHRGDEALRLDPLNLRSLCHACHTRKTNRQDGGLGRAPSGDATR